MNRSAIAIGVDKCRLLPELHDAAKGAQRFGRWASAQGMDPVTVITDERGKVTLQNIKDAVKAIVDKGTVEQLLVYFAGHGVNIRFGEYWLLSEAPTDTQAAVNVTGSVTLARYCGIPHVVLISDACRTAAEGAQAQFVSGGEIFPNEGVFDQERPVDQFFACTLGRPAHEIKDSKVTAGEYKALYTGVLLDSLAGDPPTLVDWAEGDRGHVRPRPLKAHLYEAVLSKILEADLQTKVMQIPDARITSDEAAWLAELTLKPRRRTRAARRIRGRRAAPPPPSPEVRSRELVRQVLEPGRGGRSAPAPELPPEISEAAQPFGVSHHESKCGFKIRGGRFTEAFASRGEVEKPAGHTDDLRAYPADGRFATVLLTLDSGTWVALPALDGYLCALTVSDGELVDVAYEPSDNSERWQEFADKAGEIRALRAIAADATSNGVFRLEGEDGLRLARRMQYAKGVDPGLAVYAAYAYREMGRTDLVTEMGRYLQQDLGGQLFDIALLAGWLRGARAGKDSGVIGFAPLLSQGWADLPANQVELPDGLRGVGRYVLSAPWTMFRAEGGEMIRAAMEQGAIG